MTPDTTDTAKPPAIRNWIGLVGALLTSVLFILQTVLLVIDLLRGHGDPRPYFHLTTYMLLPVALAGSIALVIAGAVFHRWRLNRRGIPISHITIPGTRSAGQWIMILIALGVVLLVGTVTLYRAYHYTETVEFCGLVCHGVMEPEYTAFQNSPHANGTCVQCHVGPGAKAFVQSKIDGLYEVYSLAFNKFHRPIPPPVKNLRPARETCRTCHWPEKFFGAVLRSRTYHLPDEENSPWTIKMLMNIGGGDPRHGPVEGIHWHMEKVNTIEYVTTDEKRLVIPWMRVTDQQGEVTVYRTEIEDEAITDEEAGAMKKHVMDCMDCHNRPTHRFESPNRAIDMALMAGTLDRSMPDIKYNAASLLADDYENLDEALEAIESTLREEYDSHPGLEQAIPTVQTIFRNNFFPEMKVRWDAYPDNIGHKTTPGCFRCHDGKHASESGRKIRNDCRICHTIITQGPNGHADTMSPEGLEFQHPEDIDGEWKTERCDSCHTGAP